jgi:hypothetical protein
MSETALTPWRVPCVLSGALGPLKTNLWLSLSHGGPFVASGPVRVRDIIERLGQR